jgi:cell wall-associated NlpC family hydrolase
LVGASALAGALVPVGAEAAPARRAGTPTVASVTARLDQLAQRTEVLTEQYNATRYTLRTQARALAAATRERGMAEGEYASAEQQFAALAAARYETGTFSTTGAILTSPDSTAFLNTLATQDLVTDQSAGVLARLDNARERADRASAMARALIAAAQVKRQELASARDKVIADTATERTLLSALTSAQRLAYIKSGAPTPAEVAAALQVRAPSAAAQRAVDFAVAQVGKPYVWAAAGPDAFDCSGLTMRAWQRGGVSLPHFSAAQYASGPHVGYNQLEPGDLVFLYSDIHHVEIYIGDGIAISAPQEGEPVQFVHLADFRSDFYGATRFS